MNYQDYDTQLAIIARENRAEMIDWLEWNDPDGCYSDEEVLAEGFAMPLENDDLRLAMSDQIEG